jgi:hypothetical protein
MRSSKFEWLRGLELSLCALLLGVLPPLLIDFNIQSGVFRRQYWLVLQEVLPLHPSWQSLAPGVAWIGFQFGLAWLITKSCPSLFKRIIRRFKERSNRWSENGFARLIDNFIMAGLLFTIFWLAFTQSATALFPFLSAFLP